MYIWHSFQLRLAHFILPEDSSDLVLATSFSTVNKKKRDPSKYLFNVYYFSESPEETLWKRRASWNLYPF